MLADFHGLIDNLLRDREQVISAFARDAALNAAVQRYSLDRPREVVEDVVALADGYVLPLPSTWLSGFSRISQIELYPASASSVILPGGECLIYVVPPSTHVIRLSSRGVSTGDVGRVSFHLPHTLDGASDTIPESARQALASYSAAILADQLAAHYAGDSDPTIQADAVNHQSKSQAWAARARSLREMYFKFLGVEAAPKLAPAGGQVVWPARKRFTHGVGFRV